MVQLTGSSSLYADLGLCCLRRSLSTRLYSSKLHLWLYSVEQFLHVEEGHSVMECRSQEHLIVTPIQLHDHGLLR